MQRFLKIFSSIKAMKNGKMIIIKFRELENFYSIDNLISVKKK